MLLSSFSWLRYMFSKERSNLLSSVIANICRVSSYIFMILYMLLVVL